MIIDFLRKALASWSPARPKQAPRLEILRKQGVEAFQSGEYHAACDHFLEYLESRPEDIEILNHLGCCYANLGRTAQAALVFERACALDDTNLFSLLNRANACVDNKNTEEALDLLRQAVITHLAHVQCGQILSRILFFRGDGARSASLSLSGWLAQFDDLRAANHYLFSLAYPDDGEATLAIEHRFWGDTLKALPAPGSQSPADLPPTTGLLPARAADASGVGNRRRVRIGYWSPDFREHSVRFFSRPLIESHDRQRFELYAYHDYHQTDRHTEAIRDAADHFHDVSGLKDQEVEALIVSHELDVLVELAGHTSFNRLSMFARRLARLQMNGLGYPPTTGLRSMDGKIMDATICPEEESAYYTERPLRLPSSLWCFDPKEDIPLRLDPPVQTNGHLTFACMGNLAKINRRTLQCWAQILNQVPDSRLVVRAFNYQDPAALRLSQSECEAAGLPMDRVELLPPVGVAQLFQAYGDIDIVLDTFPFNGGTTSCFAAYMGVPVVSRYGASLVSRVGLSILTHLQLSHLAVDNDADYVRTAVALAHDIPQLQAIRARARELFKTTALGNGELFAREFEAACLTWLAEPPQAATERPCRVPTLPPDEMVRRAYALRGHGNTDAARRVIELCLRHHPQHANAHVFVAQQLALEQSDQAGLDYLWPRLAAWGPTEQVSPLIAAVHLMLRLGQRERACAAVNQLSRLPIPDDFDRLQVALFESTLSQERPASPTADSSAGWRALIVVPCQDATRFDALREHLLHTLEVPRGGRLEILACDPQRRWETYAESARTQGTDLLIALHPNVRVVRADFLQEVVQALQHCDVLSFGGACRWERLDWRNDRFDQKSAGYLVATGESAAVELRLVGPGREALATPMAVLDGALLALRPGALAVAPVDEELARCDTLMEELWAHEVQRQGLRLGVHRGLGVVLGEPLNRPDIQELSFGRQRLVERLEIDPLKHLTTDELLLSARAPLAHSAIEITQRYLSRPVESSSVP